MIVLDTSVLSALFRRGVDAWDLRSHFLTLVEGDVPLATPGIVLQEILSSARTSEAHRRLQMDLAGIGLLLATRTDHVAAADLFRASRAAGLTISAPDDMIAAQALPRGRRLWTLDKDFERMNRVRPLRLYRP